MLDAQGVLRNAKGEAFEFEYLSPGESGRMADWQANLALGEISSFSPLVGGVPLRGLRMSSEEGLMAEDDRSSGFNLNLYDWDLFDAMLPYTGSLLPAGNGCAPTPGAPNICPAPVANEAASFGGVKAIFR